MDKLEIQNNGLNGIIFRIGDSERKLTPKLLHELKSDISKYLEWYEYWDHEINWYKDYSLDKIDEILKEQEEDFDEEYVTYSIGENYAAYLETVYKKTGMADNHVAAEILKKEYSEEYGENTLEFDPESSFCYVYTKDKKEAKLFMWWVYTKYIMPAHDKILN